MPGPQLPKLSPSRHFLFLSLAILIGVSVFVMSDPQSNFKSQSSKIVSPLSEKTIDPPERIKISKLDKDLEIKASVIVANQWQVFDNQVAWLSTSSLPGEGNVILYAHNKKELFGNLYQLQSGDIIEIKYQGHWIRYEVYESKSVTPKDIQSVLSDRNQLTLYTCEGSFDQKRRVVYAAKLD